MHDNENKNFHATVVHNNTSLLLKLNVGYFDLCNAQDALLSYEEIPWFCYKSYIFP